MGIKYILLPDLGEGVTEGEIIKVKISEGDSISMDQVLVEVMTDKASMEVPSSIEGLVKKIEVKEGDIVPVGGRLFSVETEASAESEKSGAPEQDQSPEDLKTSAALAGRKPKPGAAARAAEEGKSKSGALAIPAVRKLAEELSLNLNSIQGSGPQGEIKRSDLLNYIKSRIASPGGAEDLSAGAEPPTEDFEEIKREPIRGVKRLMFESMALSKKTIPHFTIGERACAEHLAKVKEEMNARLKKQNLKTGWLPFFIKALVPALKEFPIFNSFYDSQNRSLVFKKDLNIGFAAECPQGLLVPVLKKAQNKSLLEIIKEINFLAQGARSGDLERERLRGAGITISNLGSLGGFYGAPIINPPELAIIGAYRLYHQPVRTAAGEFEEKPFINFSITCDHRFIDGAMAARFLKSFTDKIEEPGLLLLE